MTHLRLTLACEDYDRTRPIKDGVVKPEGIELNYLTMSVEEIFWRMMK
jgi:4,5-dihydroxyphthalate decarboxylase